MRLLRAGLVFAIAATAASGAWAQGTDGEGSPGAGRRFALEVCTPCHVVAPRQVSPRRFATAPDFRAIANLSSTTAASLSAFLQTPHPTMPNLILTPEETRNVVSYILSLRRR